ncbi:DUF3108 domain-containing protein [Alteromonas lipotrueiana]|uniref:DUF3108 domain-containing protein n=1 Tax=Alteromonas lipotrueiana TaxID=2803815 RepID=UPI001FE54E9E|nr:DUF3108 domain-containing protein [Alteromonas lipotrueiana]
MKQFLPRDMQTIKFGKITVALALVALSATVSAQPMPAPQPFKATYIAYKWGDDVGQATMQLEALSENQYSLTYSSDVSKFFLSDERFEHSIFFIEDQQLVPSQYHYKRTGTGPDKQLGLKFESEPTPTVQIKNGDTLEWNGELDNQLYRLDIARQLKIGNHDLNYDFINYRGEKRHYGISVLGNETLSLPYGQLNTIKIKLVRDSKTRETFAWFAPKLNYQLVRLQQFKEGDEQGDIRLSEFELH